MLQASSRRSYPVVLRANVAGNRGDVRLADEPETLGCLYDLRLDRVWQLR